jgi:hypothetical protein
MTYEHVINIIKVMAESTRCRILQAITAEESSMATPAKRFWVTQAISS